MSVYWVRDMIAHLFNAFLREDKHLDTELR